VSDQDLMNELTRVARYEDRIAIQVAWITWPHPHESKTHWHTVRNFKVTENIASINESRKSIINNNNYFCVCSECNERNPRGWMLDDRICQSCAEKNHGINF